jgi:hypothetical protein
VKAITFRQEKNLSQNSDPFMVLSIRQVIKY